VVKVLHLNDFTAKCAILERLQWVGLGDPRIFDILEENVLEFYQSSFLSRQAFALKLYSIRALGYSGNEKYRNTLFLVKVEAAGKDVRRIGEQALAELDDYILWNQQIAGSKENVNLGNTELDTFAKMLNTNNTRLQRLAAIGIYHERINNRRLIAIAEKSDSRSKPDRIKIRMSKMQLYGYLERLIKVGASLKMHFFHDSRVSSVLESSCMSYTLRFCARCFLALAKKSLFLETPLDIQRPDEVWFNRPVYSTLVV
jgi:hypothetical protein